MLRSLVSGSVWCFDRLLPGVCGASIACCRFRVDGFDSSKESFSPRVSVQCRLSCGVRTVAVCYQHLRPRHGQT